MRRLGAIIGCAWIASAVLAPSAGAATITVDIPQDDATGFDELGCSLREAVQTANTNTPVSLCGATTTGTFSSAPDTIQVLGGRTHVLTKFNNATNGGEDGNLTGDIDIEGPVTITATGTGLAIVDQQDTLSGGGTPDFEELDRVFHVESTAGAVAFNRLKITGGVAGNFGPSGAPTLGGGGILTEAPLTVTDSEVVDNVAREYNVNFTAMGGGIMVRGGLARLTMTGSTVAGNTVRTGEDFNIGSAAGGGIAAFPVTNGQTPPQGVDITNSTISGNLAEGRPGGTPSGHSGVMGGIFAANGPFPGNNATPVNLTNVTITNNQATAPTPANGVVGGIQVSLGTTTGSIIAGNTDTATASSFDDCGLSNTSGGGNLIGRRSAAPENACAYAGPNDLAGTTATPIGANLGNLLPNGGPTRTHAPNPGSPAINRGGTCAATDQIGLFRYIAAPCDAGSVEIGATSVPPPSNATPTPPGPTGQRAAALAKCKKKKKRKARRKCKRKANKLPV
jgi:CSLREA domain-containing protein